MEYQPSGQASCGFNGSSGYSEMTAGPAINDGQWHTVQCVKTVDGHQGRRRRGRHLEVRQDRHDRQHRRGADRRAPGLGVLQGLARRGQRPDRLAAEPGRVRLRGRSAAPPPPGSWPPPLLPSPRAPTHVLAHRPPPPRRTARRVRRLRDLRPRARRRAPRVLRAVRAPAPRPGVGGHRRGRPRRRHHHAARARPRLAGLQGARPARAARRPRDRPRPLLDDGLQRVGELPARPPLRRLGREPPRARAGPQRQPHQRRRAPRRAARARRHLPVDVGLGDHRGAAGDPPGRRPRGRDRRRPAAPAGRLLDGRHGPGARLRLPRPRRRPAARARPPRRALLRRDRVLRARHHRRRAPARRPARRARLARRGRRRARGRSSRARARPSASSSTSTSRGPTRAWAATSLQAARGRMGEILAREAPGARRRPRDRRPGLRQRRRRAASRGPAGSRRTTASSRTATSRGRSSSPARSCASTACG